MLSVNPYPPHQEKGKRRKRERELQIGYLNNFTNNSNNTCNTNNQRNNAKYTKMILCFSELHATGAGILPVAARQAPSRPRLDSAVDGNWIQECMDQNLDQVRKKDNKQSSFQKPAMDECRVSASVQGQERLSHIDAMHSQFTLLLLLRNNIHFSYLYTRSRLFG